LTFSTIPSEHHKKLPWQRRKSKKEDPEARKRIKAIMENPNYIQGDKDAAFLRRDEVRGARLEIDYFKPELLLRDYGIESTIVVFGSTRIVEEREALRRLEKLRRDGVEPEEVRRAERLLAKSRFYEESRKFGQIVGACGDGPEDNRVTLMTGGGPGIMEAANRGAFDVGAKSVGLNITLPHEQYPNPYITPDLCFQVHYFAIRKLHFLRRAKALVVFPGGYGTLDECFEVLTLIQTRKIDPMPVIFVGEAYWKGIVSIDMLVEEGTIDPEDHDLFCFAETAEEAWGLILQWYEQNGGSLYAPRKRVISD